MMLDRAARKSVALRLGCQVLLPGLLAAFGVGALQPQTVDFGEIEDRRSYEVIVRNCRSELGRSEITLFGNGTLRRRFGPLEESEMTLFELTESEVKAYLNRLALEDLSETDASSTISGGDWIDRCVVTFRLPGQESQTFSYGPFDSLSLALSRVLAIADELEKIAREESSRSRLPIGYLPQVGDVLERFNGDLFRVRGYTALKRGVELEGIEQPMTLFVAIDELSKEFVELISRRQRYR